MLRLDKSDKNYTLVEYTDILTGVSFATKTNNETITDLLNNLFVDSEDFSVYIGNKHFVRLKTDSEVVRYLKEEVKVLDYDNFIDHNILSDAFTRSIYEFNHEMRKKLSTYLRMYMDNEIKGIDNKVVKDQIINDKKLLEYIKEYEGLDEYLERKIEISLEVDENIRGKGKRKSKVG